ncbi:thioredoxin [Stagonosporopsis vannaccii]|nr:thioredoxin [Stagonosporopsis vannaccii]
MSENTEKPQQLINGQLKPLSGMEAHGDIPIIRSKAEYLKAVMYEGVTILEGTATWCAQCKAIAPEVAKMVSEYPDVKFYLYDVEECEDVAQELGVSSMPSFSIFKDGDIQDGVTGAKPKEIRKKIEACL